MNPCYVFDIEGTLSNTTHRDHHVANKEWDQWHNKFVYDPPRLEMVRLAQLLKTQGEIFLFTGKHESYRFQVERWLTQKSVPYDQLYMRPTSDWSITNSQIKAAMLDDIEKAGWAVLMAFDDMHAVAQMYRERGIPCLIC